MRYRIYRGEDSSTASLIDSTGAEWFGNSTGLPLQDYTYRVAAVDSTGFEGHSARRCGPLHCLECHDRSRLRREKPAFLSTAFRWMQVRAAERYRLKVSADSGLTQSITDSVVSDTVVSVNGVLERGRRYFWPSVLSANSSTAPGRRRMSSVRLSTPPLQAIPSSRRTRPWWRRTAYCSFGPQASRRWRNTGSRSPLIPDSQIGTSIPR